MLRKIIKVGFDVILLLNIASWLSKLCDKEVKIDW